MKNKKFSFDKLVKWTGIALVSIAAIVSINFMSGIIGSAKETHKTEVTVVDINRKFEAVSEIAVYEYDYSGYEKKTDRRKFLGLGLPLTKNEVEITYSGQIKVIYDLDKINKRVDNENQIIYIELPTEVETSNVIEPENIQFKEKDNILNPIKTDDLIDYTAEIEEKELQKAIDEEQLYELAKEEIKKNIKNALTEFDYEVVFLK